MWSYDEEELARICDKLQIPYSTTDIDVNFQFSHIKIQFHPNLPFSASLLCSFLRPLFVVEVLCLNQCEFNPN